MPSANVPRNEIVLQTITLPDPEITTDTEMFLWAEGGASVDLACGEIDLPEGASVDFDTYFNLFNLGTWSRAAQLNGLSLRLSGKGSLRVEVMVGETAHDRASLPPERDERLPLTADATLLCAHEITLGQDAARIELAALIGATGAEGRIPPRDGLLWLRLVAGPGGATLTGGSWRSTSQAARDDLRLAICVTSYQREAETARMAERVTAFLDAEVASLGADVALIITDNGQSLALPPHPRLQVIANRNLGGSGGFARGLAEARTRAFSHVLFMDDDAGFMMENLRRTIAFLRLANSDKAAVAGAMISAGRPSTMWENGAVFDRICRPLFIGANLHDPVDVGLMELRAARPKPENFYGGWWFFAFPIAAVTHDPFPFFVRGDDISFSLANQFDTVTLSGVVSFQEDFAAKESPLTLYLDLRNHLHHHLVHDSLDTGAWSTTKIALRFVLRGVIRMHYDSAEATLAAWEDMMKGPVFFSQNVDVAARRAELQAMSHTEKWGAMAPIPETALRVPPPVPFGRVMKFLLNGHLVPLYGLLGRHVDVPVSQRGLIWPIWGARSARFYDASGRRGYAVQHSKRRGWSIMWRSAKLANIWIQNFAAHRLAHRVGYDHLTSPEFWQAQFAADAPNAPRESESAGQS